MYAKTLCPVSDMKVTPKSASQHHPGNSMKKNTMQAKVPSSYWAALLKLAYSWWQLHRLESQSSLIELMCSREGQGVPPEESMGPI